MIAIMIPIKPKWVAKILNGDKTIEVRKRFPKDYKGWVYIYCTKEDSLIKLQERYKDRYTCEQEFRCDDFPKMYSGYEGKGKVVARFYCDNVEDFGRKYAFAYKDDHFYEILEKACIDTEELGNYYHPKRSDWENGKVHLHAVYINEVKIFDEPKELSEFRVFPKLESIETDEDFYLFTYGKPLTKAPQNYCYVEVE